MHNSHVPLIHQFFSLWLVQVEFHLELEDTSSLVALSFGLYFFACTLGVQEILLVLHVGEAHVWWPLHHLLDEYLCKHE